MVGRLTQTYRQDVPNIPPPPPPQPNFVIWDRGYKKWSSGAITIKLLVCLEERGGGDAESIGMQHTVMYRRPRFHNK